MAEHPHPAAIGKRLTDKQTSLHPHRVLGYTLAELTCVAASITHAIGWLFRREVVGFLSSETGSPHLARSVMDPERRLLQAQ